jgi:hypothetical protein
MKLTVEDFQHWAEAKWELYASTTRKHDNKRVTLWCNFDGEFKVVFEENIVYGGSHLHTAIGVFNSYTC